VATLRAFILLLAIATGGAVLTALLHPHRPPWQRPVPDGAISAATLAAWLAEVPPPLILDARTAEEHAAGTIPGALPYHDPETEAAFLRVMEAWTPGRRVVVFCGATGCDLSRQLAIRLQRDLGDPTVTYLDGGWESWVQSR